jgi:hypothetical protein
VLLLHSLILRHSYFGLLARKIVASSLTPETLAAELADLAAEHGVPNRFNLGELRVGSALAVSRIARLESLALNSALAASGLRAVYEYRRGADAPATVCVESLVDQKENI